MEASDEYLRSKHTTSVESVFVSSWIDGHKFLSLSPKLSHSQQLEYINGFLYFHFDA